MRNERKVLEEICMLSVLASNVIWFDSLSTNKVNITQCTTNVHITGCDKLSKIIKQGYVHFVIHVIVLCVR